MMSCGINWSSTQASGLQVYACVPPLSLRVLVCDLPFYSCSCFGPVSHPKVRLDIAEIGQGIVWEVHCVWGQTVRWQENEPYPDSPRTTSAATLCALAGYPRTAGMCSDPLAFSLVAPKHRMVNCAHYKQLSYQFHGNKIVPT